MSDPIISTPPPQEEEAAPSLVRQLLGAAVGSAVALTLYGSYQYAAPTLQAHFSQNQVVTDGARFAEQNLDTEDRTRERRVRRNDEVAVHGAAPESEQDVLDHIAERAKNLEMLLNQEQVDSILEEPVEPAPAMEEAMETEEMPAPVDDVVVPLEMEQPLPEPAPAPTPAEWEHNLATAPRETVPVTAPLPDSGVGVWLAVVGALGAAVWMQRKRFFAF